jgi:eukaryotic-like serine/threonine-protein kinase
VSTPPPGEDAATRTARFGIELDKGSEVAGRYRIEGLLGIGGMGVVYRAFDRALEVPVALKLLRPELAQRSDAFERFRAEILLARQVSSPRVVRIHDIGQHEGRWLISMDLVEGESLERLLEREGALPVERAIAIARDLAEALAAAHSAGVVHRDLKPANVLIDAQGRARVSDFGIARSLGSSGATRSGVVVGTPEYLAPEQARGGAIDGRADLYALGLILFEMLAGRRAFEAETPAELLGQRMVASPPPLRRLRSELPPWLERLVARLLRTQPAQRPADAATVIAILDRRRLPPSLPPARNWLPVAALVLVLAALAWWLPQLKLERDPEPPQRLMVVATAAQAPLLDAAEAIAEQLRQGFASLPVPAVADGERTAIALAQAGIGLVTPAGPQPLATLPAQRVLHLHLEDAAGGLQLSARWAGEGARSFGPFEAASALELARALQSALTVPGGVGAGLPDLLPAESADLEALGVALRLRREGALERAAQALAELGGAPPPAFAALARWLQFETLRRASQRGPALEALRAAPTDAPLAARFQRWRRALEGDPAAAQAALEQRLARQPDDLSARLDLAELALEQGRFEVAIAQAEYASRRDPADPQAWFVLGKATLLQGDPRRAVEEHFVRAMVGFKRARHRRGEAETANALGVGYARLGQIEDAAEQYRKGLELRRALGDRRGTAASLHNLAQIDLLKGQLDQAAERLGEAGALFAAVGDHAGSAAVENETGLLHEERGDYRSALEAYRRALRSRQLGGDAAGEAESLNNLAYAHYQLGDYDNAGALWRQAGEAFAALDDANGRIRVQQNLGLLDLARGEFAEAERRLRESLADAEARQLFEEAAVSHRNLAELALLQGRWQAAAADLGSARRLFEARGDQRGLLDADLLEVRLLQERGDSTAARARLEALAKGLAEASLEQRAIAALLDAGLAAAESDANAQAALEGAAELADRAGIERLRLQAALARDGADLAGLEPRIEALGDHALRLQWVRRAIESAQAAGAHAEAVERYLAAQALLRTATPAAARVHAAAARSYLALGRREEADAARGRADESGGAEPDSGAQP